MGKYESNERALEVLTEIFAKIDESDGLLLRLLCLKNKDRISRD